MSAIVTILNEIKEAHEDKAVTRIKLVNGHNLKGIIKNVGTDAVAVQKDSTGGEDIIYTIPFTSILYISDCELSNK